MDDSSKKNWVAEPGPQPIGWMYAFAILSAVAMVMAMAIALLG